MTVVLVDSKHYGYALRNGRKSTQVSLNDAAAALGMTRDALSRIENGASYMPTSALMRLMVLAYRGLKSDFIKP